MSVFSFNPQSPSAYATGCALFLMAFTSLADIALPPVIASGMGNFV